MVVLKHLNKKIIAASLVETLIASVLIIIVFTIASLSINALFKNNTASTMNNVNSRLNALEYFYSNDQVKLPYSETYENGDISIILANNTLLLQWESKTKIIERSLYIPE